MAHWGGRLSKGAWIAFWTASSLWAQQKILTWDAAKAELLASNPALRAGQIGVQEAHAEEITAFLRPNPDLTLGVDQLNPFTANPYRPLTFALPFADASYLLERRHKRDLRLASAKGATEIAISQLADQKRDLLFDLRV